MRPFLDQVRGFVFSNFHLSGHEAANSTYTETPGGVVWTVSPQYKLFTVLKSAEYNVISYSSKYYNVPVCH